MTHRVSLCGLDQELIQSKDDVNRKGLSAYKYYLIAGMRPKNKGVKQLRSQLISRIL